jgi:hyperosmotically inducible protein
MNSMRKAMLAMSMACCAGAAWAGGQASADTAQRPATQGQASAGADNTRMNTRDAGAATQTPQGQSNAKGDRDTLATVRKTIVQDKSLSTAAHNVKILVSGGAVTLRGPVKSEEEKGKIEALAKSVAGVTRVDNQIDIKTN